tara:strand:+ start:207 stop:317 length:111 start_codon:yes stop_codon:yes gene_type:complete
VGYQARVMVFDEREHEQRDEMNSLASAENEKEKANS